MLENFIFSCNAIVPIFALIFFGYYIKEKGVFTDSEINKINKFAFKYALSTMLFINTATSSVKDNFDAKFLLWCITITLVTYFFSWGFGEIFIKDKSRIGAFTLGAFIGNFEILGLSVISIFLGDQDTGKALLVTTFVIPMYNVLSVIVLTVRNENPQKNTNIISQVFGEIIKNPLIIGICLGIPFSLLSIEIPKMAMNSLKYVGSLATPLSLICIGGKIDFKTSFTDIKFAVIATFFKQILFPVISILISIFAFGIRGEELVIIFVMTSTPTAISSYVMASNMKSDPKLASNIIILTTLTSLFTFTTGIYIMKTLNLF